MTEEQTGFRRAERTLAYLRMSLMGPPGSGKTYTALKVGSYLSDRVALIDSERGSAAHYADLFPFDHLALNTGHPQEYINAIGLAARAGYPLLIVDGVSQAWAGKGGILELHDLAVTKQRIPNAFTAWRDVNPIHNQLVDALIGYPGHIIVTLRTKMGYVMEKNEKGEQTVRKVGMEAIQREGLEYEFDIVGELDQKNTLVITKTRCPNLAGGVFNQPGEALAIVIKGWLGSVTSKTIDTETGEIIPPVEPFIPPPVEAAAPQAPSDSLFPPKCEVEGCKNSVPSVTQKDGTVLAPAEVAKEWRERTKFARCRRHMAEWVAEYNK